MKLCVDCKWSEKTVSENLYSCTHPSNYKIDIQTGKTVQKERYCNVQRMSFGWISGMCSRAGFKFEPKEN